MWAVVVLVGVPVAVGMLAAWLLAVVLYDVAEGLRRAFAAAARFLRALERWASGDDVALEEFDPNIKRPGL